MSAMGAVCGHCEGQLKMLCHPFSSRGKWKREKGRSGGARRQRTKMAGENM